MTFHSITEASVISTMPSKKNDEATLNPSLRISGRTVVYLPADDKYRNEWKILGVQWLESLDEKPFLAKALLPEGWKTVSKSTSALSSYLHVKIIDGARQEKVRMWIKTAINDAMVYFLKETRDKDIPEFDISELNLLLSNNNFNEIIHDSNLFWLAFCKSFSKFSQEQKGYFDVFPNGDSLEINGSPYILKHLHRCLKEIRKIFVNNQINSSFAILPITKMATCFIREKIEVIDLRDWLDERSLPIENFFFEAYIRPYMKVFCSSLGANCSDVLISQKTRDVLGIYVTEVKAFQIKWMPTADSSKVHTSQGD
jgi:hypothetical protein